MGTPAYLIVSDVAAARIDLVARGIDVSEVFHPGTPGAQFQLDGSGRISGPAAEHATYNSFATFRDPDGNGWLLQEVTTRLPGRGYSNLDVATLTELLEEAEKHHSEYEPTAPEAPLVGLVCRLHYCASGGQDTRRGSQERQNPHRGPCLTTTMKHFDALIIDTVRRARRWRLGLRLPDGPSRLSNAINSAAHA
jgi:hypothetical protein